MTNVEALKNLYTALGGNAADVADAVTNVDVLNVIAGFLGGEGNATSISEAIENISAVAPTGGGDIDALIDRSITEINSNAVKIGINAFNECNALITADFFEATAVGDSAFYQCSALETVNCPKVTTLGANAFENCTSLTDVNLPDVVTINKPSVFKGCSSLIKVNFPKLTTISGYSTFSACTSLTTADLPELTEISGSAVFGSIYGGAGCRSLTAIILRHQAVVSLTRTDVFTDTPIASGTGYIYVPDNLVDNYKAATNWSTYADQIKGISELPTE